VGPPPKRRPRKSERGGKGRRDDLASAAFFRRVRRKTGRESEQFAVITPVRSLEEGEVSDEEVFLTHPITAKGTDWNRAATRNTPPFSRKASYSSPSLPRRAPSTTSALTTNKSRQNLGDTWDIVREDDDNGDCSHDGRPYEI